MDDDPSLRSGALAPGIAVYAAALRNVIENQPIDVVIPDAMMLGEDGLWVARHYAVRPDTRDSHRVCPGSAKPIAS